MGATGQPSDLVVVDPGGGARKVAGELAAPNGMVITEDGSTLIVAEFEAHRLLAFTIRSDGSLSDAATWADLPIDCTPDGLCLDESGAVWVACGHQRTVRHVSEGGQVLDTVSCTQLALACMLGGADRRRLYICTAPGTDEEARNRGEGAIEWLPVEVPGAGYP